MKLESNGVWGLRSTPGQPMVTRAAPALTRLAVTVTFLRQDAPPAAPPPGFPAGYTLARIVNPSVKLYRHLYHTVGAAHVWWLRRLMPDDQLAALLGAPGLSIHVLRHGDEPAGFYELDARQGHTVNLSYFGLMPGSIGQGLGMALLKAAIDTAWAHKPRALTVNTCTADHPRALPNYLATGFTPIRTVREVWEVPDSLGLVIPDRLRV